MMMTLFDEEQVLKAYVQSEKEEAVKKATKRNAIKMLKAGKITIDDIQEYYPELTEADVKEIAENMM